MLDNIKLHSFENIIWLGGSPCSGKSSISDILASQYDINVYHVDDAYLIHRPQFTPKYYPINFKWAHKPWQELWAQSQETLLKEAIDAYTEHLRFIFADLSLLQGFTIAEGTSLLPDYIQPLIHDNSKALWIVPSEAFQRSVYPQRSPFVNNILQQCENPQKALQNWMDRDVAFAQWVMERTHSLGFRCIQVDGHRSIEENAELAAKHFQLNHHFSK